MGILFYVYLFGIRQTQSRQVAWFKSFVIWIVLEVILVSSSVVLVQHVLIPLLTLRDVKMVKERVVRDIVSFNAKVKRSGGKYKPKQRPFNAASFLFPSWKLAALNSGLKESSMITRYHTAFPKKAFRSTHQSGSVKGNYDMRFQFLKQAISRIAIFAIASMVQLPPPVQDAITQMVSSAGFGYLGMLHVRLYTINPILAFLPLATAILLVHFLTVSGKASARLELAKTVPIGSDSEDENDGNEKPLQSEKEDGEGKDGENVVCTAPAWKSRRASAVQSLGLATDLARSMDIRTLSAVRPSLPQDDHADCSDDSSAVSNYDAYFLRDENGDRVIIWEEDGDFMDPDLDSNRHFFDVDCGTEPEEGEDEEDIKEYVTNYFDDISTSSDRHDNEKDATAVCEDKSDAESSGQEVACEDKNDQDATMDAQVIDELERCLDSYFEDATSSDWREGAKVSSDQTASSAVATEGVSGTRLSTFVSPDSPLWSDAESEDVCEYRHVEDEHDDENGDTMSVRQAQSTSVDKEFERMRQQVRMARLSVTRKRRARGETVLTLSSSDDEE